MAKINDTSSYAESSPVVGTDMVIGSALGTGGDTKNFKMSDILTYIMSSSTLTLQDVCDNGSATTTGMSVGGTLGVTGATTLGSTLGVTGASTLDSVAVTNNATVGGTLGVTGATTLGSTLGVAGASTLDSVSVTNNATVGGTLGVTGATTLGSTLGVAGASTLDSVAVTNNATVGGTLGVTGATTLSNGATINGSGLAVNGSGGIVVTDVAGITSAGGPVSGTALNTSGGLLVSGTSLLGEIDSAGPADIADTLTLSKATGTGLQVDADANIDGNLTITLGSALYTNEIRTTSPVSNLSFYTGGFLRGSFTGLGVLALSGGLHVQFGGALMDNGLTINGNTFLNDELVLGGSVPSSSTDTGVAGQIAVDATHIYVCVGTNSWGRVEIDTTPF